MGKNKSNNHLDELLQNGEVILTAATHEQVMEDAAALIEEAEGNAYVSLAAKNVDGSHYAKVKIKTNEEE